MPKKDYWRICALHQKIDEIDPRSQSYQTLISLFFRFSLLRLSVCNVRKYRLRFKMAKLNSEKWKKSLFYGEKRLLGLTPKNLILIAIAIAIMSFFDQINNLMFLRIF